MSVDSGSGSTLTLLAGNNLTVSGSTLTTADGQHTITATELITGCAFDGWYYNDTKQGTTIGVVQSMTITAKPAAPSAYKIAKSGTTYSYSANYSENWITVQQAEVEGALGTSVPVYGESGGYVFYAWDTQGTYEGKENVKYLEAATADLSGTYMWSSNTTYGSYGTETGIGTGKSNTDKIKSISTAAQACDDYSVTVDNVTYDDWFLSSKEELWPMYWNLYQKLYQMLHSTFGYNLWSSSEDSENTKYAWYLTFGMGTYSSHLRNGLCYVRPVRAF